MEKLYYNDHGNGTGIDGTKYVLSGDYYFDCNTGNLIKKIAPKFPYGVLTNQKTFTLATSVLYEHLNPLLMTYLANPNWIDNLEYSETWLGMSGLILGDLFTKRVVVNGNDVIITVRYNYRATDGKKFNIGIGPYFPDYIYLYAEGVERAKNSCPYSQD